jgi:hypothetical protein
MNENKNNQILGLNNVPDNQIHSYLTNAKAHAPGTIDYNYLILENKSKHRLN